MDSIFKMLLVGFLGFVIGFAVAGLQRIKVYEEEKKESKNPSGKQYKPIEPGE